jgi:hypothetical protein
MRGRSFQAGDPRRPHAQAWTASLSWRRFVAIPAGRAAGHDALLERPGRRGRPLPRAGRAPIRGQARQSVPPAEHDRRRSPACGPHNLRPPRRSLSRRAAGSGCWWPRTTGSISA